MTSPTFIPFFFDGNQWFGKVDSVERWRSLLETYPDIDRVLDAKMAPMKEIVDLPAGYHFGVPDVQNGDTPSFGFRREHLPGTTRLEDWAKARGMDLRWLTAVN